MNSTTIRITGTIAPNASQMNLLLRAAASSSTNSSTGFAVDFEAVSAAGFSVASTEGLAAGSAGFTAGSAAAFADLRDEVLFHGGLAGLAGGGSTLGAG